MKSLIFFKTQYRYQILFDSEWLFQNRHYYLKNSCEKKNPQDMENECCETTGSTAFYLNFACE